MSRNYNKFRIEEREFRFINKIDDEPFFGIYRCKITNPTKQQNSLNLIIVITFHILILLLLKVMD